MLADLGVLPAPAFDDAAPVLVYLAVDEGHLVACRGHVNARLFAAMLIARWVDETCQADTVERFFLDHPLGLYPVPFEQLSALVAHVWAVEVAGEVCWTVSEDGGLVDPADDGAFPVTVLSLATPAASAPDLATAGVS